MENNPKKEKTLFQKLVSKVKSLFKTSRAGNSKKNKSTFDDYKLKKKELNSVTGGCCQEDPPPCTG